MGKTDTFSTFRSTAEIIFMFVSLSAVQNMIHFVHFNSCHLHHREYYELTMACPPVGLICLIDRVSRPAFANVRLRFPVKPEFFKVLFQLQFWRWYTDSFFNRLGLFILLRRLCSHFFSLSALQNMIHFIYFNSSFLKLNKNVRKCHKSIPICNGIALTYK